MKNQNHPWAANLTAFYDFVERSQVFLKTHTQGEATQQLLRSLEKQLEELKETATGTQYRELKYDSALYRDMDRVAALREFVQAYPRHELVRFQSLMDLELEGLTGDLQPRAVLTSTIPAAILLGLALAAGWSKLWSGYFDFDVAKIFGEVLVGKLQQISWLGWLAPLIFVFGGFAGIAWYVTASYRNLKQVSYLRSLKRAVVLFLAEAS